MDLRAIGAIEVACLLRIDDRSARDKVREAMSFLMESEVEVD